MKNSKFIQSSKDKLSRSFNPSKCKTSLRLAASRSKLLRNRKENPLKQMKKETAQLLLSGQDQAAFIRVEHVIREEKVIAAFELIEIYCELIIARLSAIESQKNCPSDLKEAIASIVFASPRCGDVPELLDVRKHFTAKYGKDFTAAAIELRPTCGVSRLMVEKLSASTSDTQTKIKILSAIAKEHNVKWDQKPLEVKDSVPSNDLQGGPSTFGSASQPYVKPSRYSPDGQPPQSNTLHDSPSNSSCQDTKTSPLTDNLTLSQTSSSSTCFQRNESPPQSQPYVEPSRYSPEAQASEINTMHDSQSNFSQQDTKTSPQTENLTLSQTSSSSTYLQRNESPPHKQSQPYVEPSCYSLEAQASEINTMHDSQSNSSHQDTKTSPQTENLTLSQTSSSSTYLQHNESPPHRQSKPFVEPSHYSPDAQASEINTMHDSQSNSSHRNTKTSPETENLTPSQNSSPSTNLHREVSPPRRQNLTMEFKDATSAAKAAAESAEQISMAAKAAAELANGSRIMRQNSSESCKSEVYVSKDEVPESYLIAKQTSENISKDRVDSPYIEDTRLQNKKIDGIAEDRVNTSGLVENGYSDLQDYSQSVSLNSKISIEEDLSDHSVPVEDVYSQRDSLKHEVESPNELPEGSEIVREEKVSEQQSFKSSRSNSCVSDDLNTFANSEHPEFDYDADNDNFINGDVVEENSASVHFDDKIDSDGEDHGFDIDTRYTEPESEFLLPLPSHKSTELSASIRDSWDPESSSSKIVDSTSSHFTRKNSSTDCSENLASVNDLEHEDLKPVAFDDIDGPVSESDEHGSTFQEEVSSNHACEGMRTSQEKSSYTDSTNELSSKNSYANVGEPNDSADESNTDSRVGLNFGKLTGGLRHKSYNDPLYLKNQLGGASPPKEESDSDTLISGVQSYVEDPMTSEIADNKNRTRTTPPKSDLDSDTSEEEVPQRKSPGPKLKIQEFDTGKEIKPNLGMGYSNSIFGSGNSDSDEDGPQEPLSRKPPLRGGISRRTKPSSRTSIYSNTRLKSEALASEDDMDRKPKSSDISDIPEEYEPKKQETCLKSEALASGDDMDRKKPKYSYISDIPEKFEPENKQEMCLKPEANASDDDIKPKSSDIVDIPEECDHKNKQETSEQPASPKLPSKPARSNFWGPPEPYAFKTTPVTKQEAKAQVTDAETSNKTGSKDDSSKRASHVHPKLPDYDSLLQTLRVNRS